MIRMRSVFALGGSAVLAAGTAYFMETAAPELVELAAANRPQPLVRADVPPPAGVVTFAARPEAAPEAPVEVAAAEPPPPPVAPEVAPLELATAAPEPAPAREPIRFDTNDVRSAGFLPSLPGAMPFGGMLTVSFDASTPRPATGRAAQDACAPTLSLDARPAAMIGLALDAPCHADARVVIRHAGLAVTARTDAQGALRLDLPAFDAAGGVVVTLPGNTVVTGAVAVPELVAYDRVAVQWQGDDAFMLQAYENGAAFGAPGHVSGDRPAEAARATAGDGGFVVRFDGAGVDWPLMAEIYTWPVGAGSVDVEVEAPVTDATCGREMMGETVFIRADAANPIRGGEQLSVAMPDCVATGGFIVLKNLFPGLNIATN